MLELLWCLRLSSGNWFSATSCPVLSTLWRDGFSAADFST
jgi:hypothetical protein